MADIIGTNGNDTLNGGTGSDTINGLDGHDELITNEATSGVSDTLNGGAGNDTLRVNAENNQVSHQLNGGTGDDHLYAGLTGSNMAGGEGSDHYYVNTVTLGYGGVIDNTASDGASTTDVSNIDTGSGITSTVGFSIYLRADNSTLEVHRPGSSPASPDGEPLLVTGFDTNPLDSIVFTFPNGTTETWNSIEIDRRILMSANPEEVTEGTANDDVLHIKGNDFFDKTLTGGDGNDTLYNLNIESGSVNHVLDGGDGDDQLYAEPSGNTMHGGTGSDTYYFYEGADTPPGYNSYSSVNYGRTIIETADSDASHKDVIQFVGNVLPEEILVSRSGRDIEIRTDQAGRERDVFVIKDYFTSPVATDTNDTIEEIVFTDGTVWDKDDISQAIIDDLTFTFNLGDGDQSITIDTSSYSEIDVLVFGPLITPADL